MSKKFIILGAARTGSTLLVKTLNTVAGVRCHGELLGPDRVRGYEDGVDLEHTGEQERRAREQRLLEARDEDPLAFITAAMSGDYKAGGFKVIYSTFALPQWQDLIATLLEDRDMHFVHLARHNHLRRYVSEKIANSGGPIHSGAGGRGDIAASIEVNIEEFQQHSAQVEAEFEAINARLAAANTLQLSYENLARNTADTVAGVCDFLDVAVEREQISPALQKVGAADLRDTISNYDELLNHNATREQLLSD